MTANHDQIFVRNTRPEDFAVIEQISRTVYPNDTPWTPAYLERHIEIFPEGQFVAVDPVSGKVVGMAAGLIISWEDYDHLDSYHNFTDAGWFTNHDPTGRTFYGAEVMVDPAARRRGVGSKLYDARQSLVEQHGLLRIRAGARLPGYHRYAEEIRAEEYVIRVVRGDLTDPTLSFQLHRGFHVLAVVPGYYDRDPRSRDYAALIEWINLKVATPDDYLNRDPRYNRP